MGATARKVLLTVHVTASVGWAGAVLTFLALAVLGVTASDETARASYVAMEALGWAVLTPLAAASLVSGVVQGLGTPWGLFRHYWVVVKLALTVVATAVLLAYLSTLDALAAAAAAAGPFRSASPVLHAAGAAVVLLTATALSVFKPKGLTRHGWRAQQRGRRDPA